MRGQHHEVQDLSRLAGLSGEELRAGFRRALANLASQAAQRALPLEGLDPAELLVSVRHALAHGLFQDLSWLSAASGAVAIYEIMAALPASEERDRLNQAVATWLADADAQTFVALATCVARGTRTGFRSAGMRARVSLSLALPLGCTARVDGLALALISQPEYARAWVEEPSQGALPSRRLAARVLERAAREAARLSMQRDDSGVRALEAPVARAAWDRLLADRESLVWRHVAAARGLMSATTRRYADEIKASLDPDLSPTEWRRGAASLVASLAVSPTDAVVAIQQLLGGALVRTDSGLASAMMLGLPRAAEAEPQIAEKLVPALLRKGGLTAIEAFYEVLGETLGSGFGFASRELACSLLQKHRASPDMQADDTALATIDWLSARMTPDSTEDGFDHGVARAVQGFVSHGAGGARDLARTALARAQQAYERLAEADLDTAEGRAISVGALSEIDLGLLTGSTLIDLVALDGDDSASVAALHELFEQLTAWLLAAEQAPIVGSGRVVHATLRMRRVRTLLHLVDADGSYGDDGSWVLARTPRRQRTARVLLNRALKEAPSPLRRAVLACLARAFDALVRDQVFELSDVILCASLYIEDAADVATLSEACMVPELSLALSAVAKLARSVTQSADNVTSRRDGIRALEGLVATLPAAHSPRVSMLRWCLLRLQLALEVLHGAVSQADLVDTSAGNAMEGLSEAVQGLAQLVTGTRKRLAPNAHTNLPSAGLKVRALGALFEEAVASRQVQSITGPLAELDACLLAELPAPLYSAVMRIVSALKSLPLHASGGAAAQHGDLKRTTLSGGEDAGLPNWMPATRLLGGFYVLHSLGAGGVGSVFVVCRAAERENAAAENFALKVPEYNGDVAHVLSEADFLKMFREEAGALLALPDDAPNLARFVTFDAGVKPKPILVMEHVEGPSLERLMARRQIDVSQAFDVLIGVAGGLLAMHGTGIAHLDVKPSNVILRDFWSGAQLAPVLVDFGLSGRRLRPGCGTASYAAPEIWGAKGTTTDDPRPADVYAFGCLAYELLMGQVLFDGSSEVAIVTAHVSHDGSPAHIQALHRDLGTRPLAEMFSSCLRQKPAARAGLSDVIKRLQFLRADLGSRPWPLVASAPTQGRPGRAATRPQGG